MTPTGSVSTISQFSTQCAYYVEELSGMTWALLVRKHPERAIELQLLWSEILDLADYIVHDPDLTRELVRRILKRTPQ
jgi:hypothetical protein